MAQVQINTYLDLPIGRLRIYADKEDLEKAKKLIDDMPELLTEAYLDAANRWGGKLKKEAIRCIETNQPPKGVSWPPLSPKYVASMGDDNRRYFKGGQYEGSIDIYTEDVSYMGSSKKGTRVYVGLKNGVKKEHPKKASVTTNLTLQEVAKILEAGTKDNRIPPRPLWKPLYEQFGGKKSIERHVINAIKRKLKPYM